MKPMKLWSRVYEDDYVQSEDESSSDESLQHGLENKDLSNVVGLEADTRDIQLVDGPPPDNFMEDEELEQEQLIPISGSALVTTAGTSHSRGFEDDKYLEVDDTAELRIDPEQVSIEVMEDEEVDEGEQQYGVEEEDEHYENVKPRQLINDKHPKFQSSTVKYLHPKPKWGWKVNPSSLVPASISGSTGSSWIGSETEPTDEDYDEMNLNQTEEATTLALKWIKVLKQFRKPEDGNEVLVSGGSRTKALYLGGGIPLDPVLANPQLNRDVEKFRKELGKHRKTCSTVKYLHPKPKWGWKVDPSSIVPASRSPSTAEPEFDVEEPEFILSHNVGSHVHEPPTKKRKQKDDPQPHIDGKIYSKPTLSYSCLIAMSLKNSKTGCLPVSEIYTFMCNHFPYFKTAPSGWKNSVRHHLSRHKYFDKTEKPGNGARKGKGCLWAMNPAKIHKMDEEVQKWSRNDPMAIRRAMSNPENLELLERGEMKKDYSGNGSDEDEEFSEPGIPLTPAQLQSRRSRTSSADSAFGESMHSPALTTVSQACAAMHRPQDRKIHIKKDMILSNSGQSRMFKGTIFVQHPEPRRIHSASRTWVVPPQS